VTSIDRWWSEGDLAILDVRDRERVVFVRRFEGPLTAAGPLITLLHGFPSSSHDWARIAPSLAAEHPLLLPDFLGFGATEKPGEHDYSIHEQADLVEALWAHDQVTATRIVAHDYAVSVVQELLARRAEGRLAVDLLGVHLLNGGLYPDLHRPEPVQKALLDPEQGPRISEMLNEELMIEALKPTFAPDFDATPDSIEIWRSISRANGHRIAYRLIRYIDDRSTHQERWVNALETTDVPLAFVWGLLDPVSGAHMAQRICERLPSAPFTALDEVGHWPPLEASELVAAAVLDRRA
jgi:pimeloyl-ACP methyl ester carboxylesterase